MATTAEIARIAWWREPTKDQWLAWWASWLGWTLDGPFGLGRGTGLPCPVAATAALPPTVATQSFKSIPMSRLGDGSCGDAFLDMDCRAGTECQDGPSAARVA